MRLWFKITNVIEADIFATESWSTKQWQVHFNFYTPVIYETHQPAEGLWMRLNLSLSSDCVLYTVYAVHSIIYSISGIVGWCSLSWIIHLLIVFLSHYRRCQNLRLLFHNHSFAVLRSMCGIKHQHGDMQCSCALGAGIPVFSLPLATEKSEIRIN